MYVAVQHHIKDVEAAMSRAEALLKGDGAPIGVRVLQSYLSQNQSAVNRLWEGGSVGDVQKYVDETLGDSAENFCFAVDTEHSLGLPATA